MNELIELRFALTPEEILSSARKVVLRHPLTVSYLPTLALGGLLMAFLGVGTLGAIFLGLIGLIGLYLLYMILLMPQRAYDRMPAEMKGVLVSYRFSPTGVELKMDTFQGRWDWALFKGRFEARDRFEIHPKGEGSFVLIPKRAFDSQAAIPAFRDFLQSKLPPV